MENRSANLLEVHDLRTVFRRGATALEAVNGVNFTIRRGETHALVGETGCGKTVTALSIVRLLPRYADVTGRAIFHGPGQRGGVDLLNCDEPTMRRIRGRHIGMVFQEPSAALNPVMSVGRQIAEAVRYARGAARRSARAAAIEWLASVGLPEPQRCYDRYAHTLSGGMQQRVVIAAALAGGPELLIADEPTSALDVTVQAQVLDLIGRLGRETGTALLLITHDLGVVARWADRVSVMYAGRIIESASVEAVFERPLHPYTQALIGCVPRLGDARTARLPAIPGAVPPPGERPSGCAFHPRCELTARLARTADRPTRMVELAHGARRVLADCAGGDSGAAPAPVEREPGHFVACPETAPVACKETADAR